MWNKEKRGKVLNTLQDVSWDLVIIGGGITGAGIFAEASRNGLKVLLVEKNDFCWGTSSRSSKLIHGGLRYLLQGDLSLTLHAAREREFLQKKYSGLVEPLPFLIPIYTKREPPKWLAKMGIFFYDLLAGHWNHTYWTAEQVKSQEPLLVKDDLQGAVYFVEATTDDVRLVLRLLHEGTNEHCYPLNYVEAASLIKDHDQVIGVNIKDAEGKEYEVKSSLVINATGVWADGLRNQIGENPKMRPLRGSHIIYHRERLPVNHAISFLHPLDGRPVFAYPWEGATLVGTTDLDYRESLDKEPAITPEEIDYLMLGLSYMFPDLNLKAHEAISTFAGVRPIISSGKADPSKELRDHAIWVEHGMMTVTGGKYTTFRLVAREALEKAEDLLKNFKLQKAEKAPNQVEIQESFHRRIQGYYGDQAKTLLHDASGARLIHGTETLWMELIWGARHEAVEHLSDLLLRRTRLGLLLPNGASEHFDRIKEICLKELNWDEERWEKEKEDYMSLIEKNYFVPKRVE